MPRTAEQQLNKREELKLGVTTTQQQMTSGAMKGFGGKGLMEGNFRDGDGVDRIKEPPPALQPILLALKEKAASEGIYLRSEFQSNGGSAFGTITKTGFQGTLVRTFKRFHFDDELLKLLSDFYGTGLADTKMGGNVEVAWMDFCEDVEKVAGDGKTTVGSVSLGGHLGGKSRDVDGTVDRVADPPEKLKKWLTVIKVKNSGTASIDIIFALRAAGGKPNGVMQKSKFLISLRSLYKEFKFTEQFLFSLSAAYGCGDPDPVRGGLKEIAWMDFCEDVNSMDINDYPPAVQKEIDLMCRDGSAIIGEE